MKLDTIKLNQNFCVLSFRYEKLYHWIQKQSQNFTETTEISSNSIQIDPESDIDDDDDDNQEIELTNTSSSPPKLKNEISFSKKISKIKQKQEICIKIFEKSLKVLKNRPAYYDHCCQEMGEKA